MHAGKHKHTHIPSYCTQIPRCNMHTYNSILRPTHKHYMHAQKHTNMNTYTSKDRLCRLLPSQIDGEGY